MRKQNIFIMNIKSNLRAKLNNTIKIWRQLYLSKALKLRVYKKLKTVNEKLYYVMSIKINNSSKIYLFKKIINRDMIYDFIKKKDLRKLYLKN